MKKFNLIIVLLSLAMAVSCGDDKKKKGDSVPYYDFTQNPYQVATPTVQNGLYNPQSNTLEIGGQTLALNQVYGIQMGGQQVPNQQMPYQQQPYQQQPYQQQNLPSNQLGQQYLYPAHQQIMSPQTALRPAYVSGGVVKFNVRVTYFMGKYPQLPNAIPVLTAPVVAF